ncbi:hypothetical protein GCM10027595_07010 [Corynebacterium nasicanis]
MALSLRLRDLLGPDRSESGHDPVLRHLSDILQIGIGDALTTATDRTKVLVPTRSRSWLKPQMTSLMAALLLLLAPMLAAATDRPPNSTTLFD